MEWLEEREFRYEVARWVSQMYCLMEDEENKRFLYCADRQSDQYGTLFLTIILIVLASLVYPYPLPFAIWAILLAGVVIGAFVTVVYVHERSRDWVILPQDEELDATAREAFLELSMELSSAEKEQIRQLMCLTQNPLVAGEVVVQQINEAMEYEHLSEWSFLVDLYRLYTAPKFLQEVQL